MDKAEQEKMTTTALLTGAEIGLLIEGLNSVSGEFPDVAERCIALADKLAFYLGVPLAEIYNQII